MTSSQVFIISNCDSLMGSFGSDAENVCLKRVVGRYWVVSWWYIGVKDKPGWMDQVNWSSLDFFGHSHMLSMVFVGRFVWQWNLLPLKLLCPLGGRSRLYIEVEFVDLMWKLYASWINEIKLFPLLVILAAQVILNFDQCKVKTCWKVLYLDLGFSYVLQVLRFEYKNLVLSTINVLVTSFIIRQIVLELILQMGSHSKCYELVFESRESPSDEMKHKGRFQDMWLSFERFVMTITKVKYNLLAVGFKRVLKHVSVQVYNKISSNTLVVNLGFSRKYLHALELAVPVGSLCICSEMTQEDSRFLLPRICSDWVFLIILDGLFAMCLDLLGVFPAYIKSFCNDDIQMVKLFAIWAGMVALVMYSTVLRGEFTLLFITVSNLYSLND